MFQSARVTPNDRKKRLKGSEFTKTHPINATIIFNWARKCELFIEEIVIITMRPDVVRHASKITK